MYVIKINVYNEVLETLRSLEIIMLEDAFSEFNHEAVGPDIISWTLDFYHYFNVLF